MSTGRPRVIGQEERNQACGLMRKSKSMITCSQEDEAAQKVLHYDKNQHSRAGEKGTTSTLVHLDNTQISHAEGE